MEMAGFAAEPIAGELDVFPSDGVIDVQALAFDETDVMLCCSFHVCGFLVQAGTKLTLWKEFVRSTPDA
jgi:hypothetical protein